MSANALGVSFNPPAPGAFNIFDKFDPFGFAIRAAFGDAAYDAYIRIKSMGTAGIPDINDPDQARAAMEGVWVIIGGFKDATGTDIDNRVHAYATKFMRFPTLPNAAPAPGPVPINANGGQTVPAPMASLNAQDIVKGIQLPANPTVADIRKAATARATALGFPMFLLPFFVEIAVAILRKILGI